MRNFLCILGFALLILSALLFWGSVYSILVTYAMLLLIPFLALKKYYSSTWGDDYFSDQNG